MTGAKEGAHRLLEVFLYGMMRAAESIGTIEPFMRTMQEESLREFMLANMPGFRGGGDPLEACEAYTRELGASGMMDTGDTSFRADDDGTVRAQIGAQCPYRGVCTRRDDEGRTVYCIRALALAEMLRIGLKTDYDWSLESFAVPCRVRLSPGAWG